MREKANINKKDKTTSKILNFFTKRWSSTLRFWRSSTMKRVKLRGKTQKTLLSRWGKVES